MDIQKRILKLSTDKRKTGYLLLLLSCGVLLMLISSPKSDGSEDAEACQQNTLYSVEREERRLEQVLSSIDGVGKCVVLLSVHDGAETILAEDEGETVILSGGGKQATVTVQTRYPEYQGAVIVCGGCGDPSVRYDILSSVMAYTGLGADKITICPIKD